MIFSLILFFVMVVVLLKKRLGVHRAGVLVFWCVGVNLAEKILTDYLNGEMTENDIELLQLESRFSSHSAIQEYLPSAQLEKIANLTSTVFGKISKLGKFKKWKFWENDRLIKGTQARDWTKIHKSEDNNLLDMVPLKWRKVEWFEMPESKFEPVSRGISRVKDLLDPDPLTINRI